MFDKNRCELEPLKQTVKIFSQGKILKLKNVQYL